MSSIDTFKAQARRLQAFMQTVASKRSDVFPFKLSMCLEAIAAVHGARNWNTLEAQSDNTETPAASEPLTTRARKAEPTYDDIGDLSPCPDVGVAFAELRPGVAGYEGEDYDPVPSSRTLVKHDLSYALGDGYYVTVLAPGTVYQQFAHAFGGRSTGVNLRADTSFPHTSGIVSIDFQGWALSGLLGDDTQFKAKAWEALKKNLKPRTGRGFILVVDRLQRMLELFGSHTPDLLMFLETARKAGTVIHLFGVPVEDLGVFAPLTIKVHTTVNSGLNTSTLPKEVLA